MRAPDLRDGRLRALTLVFALAVGAGPLVMTTKSADPAGADTVETIKVPRAEFEVIDDNTIRDAQGTVSRRKI